MDKFMKEVLSMNNRIISLLLCFGLLLSIKLPVYADEPEYQEEIRISNAEEFLAFAENCRLDSYSHDLAVMLDHDIDLTGIPFGGIPIFSGLFDGNGHSITGLTITADGSALGLFRYLTQTAVVRNLSVNGEIHPGGSRNKIGGLAGSNAGHITDCSFEGSISGGDVVGGLVGFNAVTGIVEDCHGAGEIHGNHFVGGIAGENHGVIRSCTSKSQINTTAQQNSVEISDITMDTLTNSEAVNTVTDIGGIAGISSGVIRSCENRGNVGYPHMGYNIGGIAGTQAGYIAECNNYADIQGRKEVGGIVGQMEPASLIEYTADTLQILQGQLGTMSGLVNQASSNAQTNASQISGQIGVLQDQAQTARDAVSALFPDADKPELPDADAILAAQSTLSSSISAMPATLGSISSAVQTTVSGLTRDLLAISGQISAMGSTISAASETIGGRITDISDQDTDEILTGKVECSANYGSVFADLNAGGIAGAMAMENDLDTLEDWEKYGEESLNFESEVRAVILRCENFGTVTGRKQNVGGIAGWQSLGLVKQCSNTGYVDGEGADYVGGISGLGTGYIRSSNVKCAISGSTYVGGIAGSASIVTDSLTMVTMTDGSEKLGAILGNAEETDSGEEKPISGNFYFCIDEDFGAIDGISYTGSAEPLELETFLTLEELPELFQSVTVRFLFEDGNETRIHVTPGGTLADSRIPAIPPKDGYIGKWNGLAEAELSDIVFDMTFEVIYTPYKTTIQSDKLHRNGLPILLIQGTFSDEATVTVAESDRLPSLAGEETLLGNWHITVSEKEHVTAARLLVDDEQKTDKLKLLICSEDGMWRESEYVADGSYITFSWNQDDTHIALAETVEMDWIWYCVCTATALLALLIFLCHNKKKNRQADTEV